MTDLLNDLMAKFSIGINFITHETRVITQATEKVSAMYLGRLIETAPTLDRFAPCYPDTKVVFSAIPSLYFDNRGKVQKLEGEIPSPTNPPPGCKFQTRCPHAIDICRSEEPKLEHLGLEHDVACHRWKELADSLKPETA